MAWTEKDLERLRQRYGSEDGGGFHDPRFRKVASMTTPERPG